MAISPLSHAGGGQSIRLATLATSAGLEIIYEDTAPAFDPTTACNTSTEHRVARHAIGGLGRTLINALPNSVKYAREGDVNHFLLRFAR